jgi:hypothetical protein
MSQKNRSSLYGCGNFKSKNLKTFAIEEINFRPKISCVFFIMNALLKINLQTYFCLLCLLSYCVSCFSILYTLEFWHRLFNTDYFLLQVSTVQFHLSERTESRTGRPALCLSSFTIVGTVQHRIEEINNVETLDRCCF